MAVARWQVPYDRAAMMATFDADLCPFVAQFWNDWPMDITEGSVRTAITQCTALHSFAGTLPDAATMEQVFDQKQCIPGNPTSW